MFTKEMATNDALVAKYAEVFVTLNGKRYTMLMCKNFEGKANISTQNVPRMGCLVTGKKAVGLTLPIKMTIYKCTEIFDDVVESFKNTGVMPRFDVQVSNEDPSSAVGRSTKVYNDVTLDGEVLLSLAGSGDDFIEQEINGFANDFTRPEKHRNPSYM